MTERRPAFLRRLRINKVALVPRGANDEADIVFFKSEDGGPERKCAECKAQFRGTTCPECGAVARTTTKKGEQAMPLATQSEVYKEIEGLAENICKTAPTLTKEQAIEKVYKSRPDLVERYRAAEPDTVETVEKTVSGSGYAAGDEGSEIVGKIDALAKRLAQEQGVTVSKGYDLVNTTSEGQALMGEYRALLNDPAADLWKTAAEWAS